MTLLEFVKANRINENDYVKLYSINAIYTDLLNAIIWYGNYELIKMEWNFDNERWDIELKNVNIQ